MRTPFVGALVGVALLASCTIQISGPPLPHERVGEGSSASADVTKVRSSDGSPATVAPPPTGTPEAPKPQDAPSGSPVACPPGIDLPSGINPRYCGGIPEGANSGGRSERFITPSGNIACNMGEREVICEARETVMIANHHNPQGDGECNGFRLSETASLLCHSEPVFWEEPDDDPTQWRVLPYGSSVFVPGYVCEVTESAVACWDFDRGHGFQLSRAHYNSW